MLALKYLCLLFIFKIKIAKSKHKAAIIEISPTSRGSKRSMRPISNTVTIINNINLDMSTCFLITPAFRLESTLSTSRMLKCCILDGHQNSLNFEVQKSMQTPHFSVG